MAGADPRRDGYALAILDPGGWTNPWHRSYLDRSTRPACAITGGFRSDGVARLQALLMQISLVSAERALRGKSRWLVARRSRQRSEQSSRRARSPLRPPWITIEAPESTRPPTLAPGRRRSTSSWTARGSRLNSRA